MVELNESTDARRLGGLAFRLCGTSAALGLLGLGLAAAAFFSSGEGDPELFFRAYLISYSFFLSLSLGALFFVILQHLTRAGWSVSVRRLAEGMALGVAPLAVLFLPLWLGLEQVYLWTDPGVMARNHVLHGKEPFLNVKFFCLRIGIYFAIWIGTAVFFFAHSVRQDRSGDPRISLRMQRWAAPAMILFALSLTFAAFDILMSLDPLWFSTIFGVYYFAGSLVGFLAVLILFVLYLQRMGRLTSEITIEHRHDLGKLLFAFVVFWAYIAFSQYLLIWYANIPEETVWFLRRASPEAGLWNWVSITLLAGHFVAPFLALISRVPKRHPLALALGAGWLLAMHWLDLFWLVGPRHGYAHGMEWPGLVDAALFVGMGGCVAAFCLSALRRCALVPEKDPRLSECLAFENY